MTSSWKVFGLLTQSVIFAATGPEWDCAKLCEAGPILVCFSQIFGFLFKNCSDIICLGHCLALACLTYILNILPRFLIFFSCVRHTKKCLIPASFLVSSSSWPSSQALWLRLFPFFMIFQIPICVFFSFSAGLRVFIIFRTTDWLQYEKRRNPSTNFVCLCTKFSIFFSYRRFYDYWALHKHTHNTRIASISFSKL